MLFGDVSFTVASHAAWLPGISSAPAWQQWIHGDLAAAGSDEPAVKLMPPMLRRRASPAGKLALEAAYAVQSTLASDTSPALPVVFASRHGECARSVELLQQLAMQAPLSPTSFSLSVHNAAAGLFSIARQAQGNAIAIAAGASTIEHAVIEACGLLADGAQQVLLVASDDRPPDIFSPFLDCHETPFGWAWLMQAADDTGALPAFSLQWHAAASGTDTIADTAALPDSGGISVLRWFLAQQPDAVMKRQADGRHWHWMRHG